jgi:dephospho-CoA kinase
VTPEAGADRPRRRGAYVVGLTGPIGAGKSTVAAMLRELGAKVLDADAIARDELVRGTVGYSAVIQRFGTEVLGEDKEIDRRKLAEKVFGDPRELDALERILHPRVIARILEARSLLTPADVLVVEAIKLLDTPLRRACDRVWIVVAPRQTMLARLAGRGVSEDEALRRLRHQPTEDEFREAADAIIVNDGDREATRRAVQRAWSEVRRA